MSTRSPRFEKDLRPIVRSAISAGWRWEEGKKGGHAMLRSPEGVRVPVPRLARGPLVDSWRKRMAQLGVG